jgi:hypothetical protein
MTVSGVATAGAPTSFSVVFRNKGIGILDSLKLPVPSAFTVSSATTSRGSLTRSGNLLTLKHMFVLPTNTVTITVAARVACAPSGTATWSATNVKGVLGIPYSLDSAGSSRVTTISGACSLRFLAQPTDSAPGEIIDDGSGGPVTVGLFDGNGAAIVGAPSVPVTVATQPGSGSPGGTPTRGTVVATGVASFNDLTIATPGTYTLTAAVTTNTAIVGDESDPFTIAGTSVPCEEGAPCSASIADPDAGVSADLFSPDGGAGTLTASLTSEDFTCGDYVPFTQKTLVFNVTASDRGLEVKVTFDPGILDNGFHLSDVEVCLESILAFADQDGHVGTKGLLPDCAGGYYATESDGYDEPVPPCVLDRSFEYSGDISVTFLTAPGDPKGRV